MIRVLTRRKGAKRNILLYFVDPVSGKEVSRSSGTTSQKEAERAAARWEEELKAYRGTSGTGWRYFRERFENEHLAEKPRKSKNSYINALDHFERIVQVNNISDVSTEMVSRVRGELLSSGKPVSTVCNILTHCRAAFKWAERLGMINRCPHFTMPKQVRRKLSRGRSISESEFAAMLNNCHTPFGVDRQEEWQHLLQVLRLSGLRLYEALQLSWDSPPIRLAIDAKPHPCIIFFGEGQKSREDEQIPITPAFAEYLNKTPADQRKGFVCAIVGRRGDRLRMDAVSRFVSAIGEAAGVFVSDDGKPASAHDLRRSFAKEMAGKVKAVVLQRIMRHSSIQTTLSYYSHLDSEDIGAALWCPGDSPESSPESISKQSKKRRK